MKGVEKEQLAASAAQLKSVLPLVIAACAALAAWFGWSGWQLHSDGERRQAITQVRDDAVLAAQRALIAEQKQLAQRLSAPQLQTALAAGDLAGASTQLGAGLGRCLRRRDPAHRSERRVCGAAQGRLRPSGRDRGRDSLRSPGGRPGPPGRRPAAGAGGAGAQWRPGTRRRLRAAAADRRSAPPSNRRPFRTTATSRCAKAGSARSSAGTPRWPAAPKLGQQGAGHRSARGRGGSRRCRRPARTGRDALLRGRHRVRPAGPAGVARAAPQPGPWQVRGGR